jgi:hypothetical protein
MSDGRAEADNPLLGIGGDWLSQREIALRLGIRRADGGRSSCASEQPPRYRRAAVGRKPNPFEPVHGGAAATSKRSITAR